MLEEAHKLRTSADEQEQLRQALIDIEREAGTGQRKWHKSRPERRLRYLNLVLEKNLLRGDIFFGAYRKPTPYFFPYLEVIERAIKAKAEPWYTARVYVSTCSKSDWFHRSTHASGPHHMVPGDGRSSRSWRNRRLERALSGLPGRLRAHSHAVNQRVVPKRQKETQGRPPPHFVP
jgi:hypothetical protein